jgi:hypothetical protein
MRNRVTNKAAHNPPIANKAAHNPPITNKAAHNPPITNKAAHNPPITNKAAHNPPIIYTRVYPDRHSTVILPDIETFYSQFIPLVITA